jgi:hypothetical protein
VREPPLPPVLFETFKRELQAVIKLLLFNVLQLRLGVVNVINIHTLETEVSQRLVELALQVRRRHAMTAGDDVVERSDAGLYESLVDIVADVARRRAVER